MCDDIDDIETRRKRCAETVAFCAPISLSTPQGIQRGVKLSHEVLTASEMLLLRAILLTLLVYTEGNQHKLGPETLSGLSDQPAQLQDLLSGLKLHLRARKIKNNAESETSRLEEISLNEYHHDQIKNNEQRQKSTYNLYTQPYTASLPLRNQELISQSALCTNGNSDLNNKYERFHELGATDRSIENIKELFTHSSNFQYTKEDTPYIPNNEDTKLNNLFTPVNRVQDIQQAVPTEKGSQNVANQGSENTLYHNNESTNSYESQQQFLGIVSSSPYNYVKNINHDNKHRHSNFENLQSQEIPQQKYVFSWLPQNSSPEIKDFKQEYIMNRNKQYQHEGPQELKQSFYPEVEQTSPFPQYRKANKVQNEYDFNKENDHTYQYPSKSSSHLEAIYNFVRNKNIDHINDLQKDVEPHLYNHQESETLNIVKKKALDIAQAKKQRPPIIIHRLVTITKHIPIPVIRHDNLTHSFHYKSLHSLKTD